MDPLTILGIAGGLALLGSVGWLLYQFRTGLQAKRGEAERETDLEEANEAIERDRARPDRPGLLERLRKGLLGE